MAMTPEGKVKQVVSRLLTATPGAYYDMPVPGGYGAATLDYIGCYQGLFFAIETKAPGNHPTKRQQQIIATMRRAGAAVFVIDCDKNYPIQPLTDWLRDHNPER